MGFVRLWPALLAVFIPGIILLYLLKQKVLNQKISALNLWKEAYENIQASTPWEKFRNNILMYMQIAALVLLITALMSPYITGRGSEYSNVLVIIDNSASMSGIYSGEETKLDVAKGQAADYVSNNDGARYTVMSVSNTADLLISGSSDKGRITDAIDNIEATDIAGSLENAVSMAQSLAAAWKNYKVIAFTDSSANMQNINCEVVDLSVQGENGAVQSLSHTVSEDGTVKVMARIDNYGKNRLATDVNLYMGDKIYDIQSVTAEPGELTGDNTAYDILNGEGDERILLVTSKNTFLEKGLKISGKRTIDKVMPKDLHAADTKEYSLVVYDGIIPDSISEDGNIIFINPPVSQIKNLADEKVKEEDKWKQDIFIYAKKNKSSIVKALKGNVTNYLDGYSFACLDVTGFKTPKWAKSFFETEDKLTSGYLGNYNGRMVAVTGFDLHNTDFPLQTEFPIFMYNLLRETMSARIADKTIYNAGEAVSIQKKGKAEKAVVIKPGGGKGTYSLDKGTAVFTDTLKAGLYNIKEGGDNVYFTVSFPEDESDVLKETVITSDNKAAANTSKKLSGVISKKMVVLPVLVLLLILLMAEWMVYRKHL